MPKFIHTPLTCGGVGTFGRGMSDFDILCSSHNSVVFFLPALSQISKNIEHSIKVRVGNITREIAWI